MSSSIAIPRRNKKKSSGFSSSPSFRESAGATPSSTSSTTYDYGSFASSSASPKQEGTAATASPPQTPQTRSSHERRPSLMSPNFSKAEHTVVNVGNSEVPRLITCVKASQGFDWNQEIFLPSYADYHFDDLERKQDPVEEIHVTDEEIAKMFPS